MTSLAAVARRLSMLIVPLVAASLLQSCSLLKLGAELRMARQQFLLVKVAVDTGAAADASSVAVLYRELASGSPEFVAYRVLHSREAVYFFVPPGRYSLVAFIDNNSDYRHQFGEPVGIYRELELHQVSEGGGWAAEVAALPVTLLRLRSSLLDQRYRMDWSISPPSHGLSPGKSNHLTLIDLDDRRFSELVTRQGMWQPLTFLTDVGYGLYLLEPWNTSKPLLVLVHGINNSPRVWRDFLRGVDTSRYQVLLYHYPSSLDLSSSAYYLAESLSDLLFRSDHKQIALVAHSMGGLITREAIQHLQQRGYGHRVNLWVTISTPWAGHSGAETAMKTSPVVAPVWENITPGSPYLQAIFSRRLPNDLVHLMVSSYIGSSAWGSKGDGVVSLRSQLAGTAQAEASQLHLLGGEHTDILNSQKLHQLADDFLNP